MVKVEIDQEIFNIDDMPTIEKYNDVIKQANQISAEVREVIYPMFLGKVSIYRFLSLLFFTIIFFKVTSLPYLQYVLLIEFSIWFILCIFLSEFFTHEIQSYIKKEIQKFKAKYNYLLPKFK